MKIWKRLGAGILVFALVLGLTVPQSASAAKKKKVKLNKKKVTLTVGKKVKLKLKNNKKKVKWSSSKKKVATVSKKGVVKAKKKGTAKITAKVGKKKYICKVTVKAKKGTTNGSGGSGNGSGGSGSGGSGSGGSGTISDGPVTGTPGKNVAINGDIFRIASGSHTYQLGLGLTTAQVNTVLGTLSTNIKRTEKSPQGFDVIAFRENGNKSSASGSEKYGTYILVYLKGGKVVGICAIAKSVSYAGLVSSGTTADTIEQSGKWGSVSWYATRGSQVGAGAYVTSTSDANVLAFVDFYGDKTTYCIQVFSSEYSVDSMTDLSSGDASCSYSDSVLGAMKTESGELINAYLAYYGVRTFGINTKVSAVAQQYANQIHTSGATDSSMVGRGNQEIKNALTKGGVGCGAWGERILIGNMDAIGFANSMVQSEDARKQLQKDSPYSVMGLGTSNVNDGRFDYPCLVIDFIDFIRAV